MHTIRESNSSFIYCFETSDDCVNRWEPQDSLAECQDLVDRFWKAVGGRKGLGRNRGHIHIKGRPDYISK